MSALETNELFRIALCTSSLKLGAVYSQESREQGEREREIGRETKPRKRPKGTVTEMSYEGKREWRPQLSR